MKSKSTHSTKHAKVSIFDSVYEAAKDMHGIGVMDSITMRKFESLCKQNPTPKLSPEKIKEIRLKEKVSQPIFAWYLNVKPTTIKKWETGENTPSGPALKLLNVVKQHGLPYITA